MPITIKDVARLAHVAPSTVSRVIANNPRISEKTKKIVREAMDQLGYHPNYHARSLANNSTKTLGLVMPSSGNNALQNPFFPEVIRGISTCAHDARYGLYLSTGDTNEEIAEGVTGMVQGRRVDGLILLYSRSDDELIGYLEDSRFPFAIIGKPYRDSDKIPHVDNDNIAASYEAANHLINLGHERIAFVGGSVELVVTIDRLTGYKSALKDAEIEERSNYIVYQDFIQEGGREAIIELMSVKEPPTGLVVADDLMAFGILNALSEMGLTVPRDISIISFNNVLLSEFSTPALTSVDIDIFGLGCAAAELVLGNITSGIGTSEHKIIPHKIIERHSTAPPKMND